MSNRAVATSVPAHSPDSGQAFRVTEPFRKRPVKYHGIESFGGWRIKMYSIVYGDGPLDEAAYAAVVPQALTSLPQPAVTAARPGVGFMIMHQGRGAHYFVLCWWDNENEVPIRVWVRQFDAAVWRPAGANESVCVWDLEVISLERTVYIQHVLGPTADMRRT